MAFWAEFSWILSKQYGFAVYIVGCIAAVGVACTAPEELLAVFSVAFCQGFLAERAFVNTWGRVCGGADFAVVV